MALSSVPTDPAVPILADASAVINLVATGVASAILKALPHRLTVVDAVPTELETGRARGRTTSDRLKTLIDVGLVDVVPLPEAAEGPFEALVVGTAAETLDDGEAATIACALALGAVAVIDERKATRICGERFPDLALASTVDVLCHPEVQSCLGPEGLAAAVFNALRDGRMSVLGHQIDWILGILGPERAAQCASLPPRARMGSPASGSSIRDGY